MNSSIEEMIILRAGCLLSAPICVKRMTKECRIPVHSRGSFAKFDAGAIPPAPKEMTLFFQQQTPEYLQIGDACYRVLDLVV